MAYLRVHPYREVYVDNIQGGILGVRRTILVTKLRRQVGQLLGGKMSFDPYAGDKDKPPFAKVRLALATIAGGIVLLVGGVGGLAVAGLVLNGLSKSRRWEWPSASDLFSDPVLWVFGGLAIWGIWTTYRRESSSEETNRMVAGEHQLFITNLLREPRETRLRLLSKYVKRERERGNVDLLADSFRTRWSSHLEGLRSWEELTNEYVFATRYEAQVDEARALVRKIRAEAPGWLDSAEDLEAIRAICDEIERLAARVDGLHISPYEGWRFFDDVEVWCEAYLLMPKLQVKLKKLTDEVRSSWEDHCLAHVRD